MHLKLKLGEHILTLQNLVTGYKVKVEYDDINYLLTIIGFSIYKSYYASNQRREICDIINILVRENKFILFHGKNDRIRKIVKKSFTSIIDKKYHIFHTGK